MKTYKHESDYQTHVIERLQQEFKDSVVINNDGSYIQGFPDLTLLGVKRFWACLECKLYEDAPHQPNQDWWVETLDRMSFARFIFPENEEVVFHELHEAYGS